MFFYLAIIFVAVLESNGQEMCLTISRTQGTCINIRDCPPLRNILERPRPLSTESINILRGSQCGFEGNSPKVCCSPNTQPLPVTLPPTPSPGNSMQFPNVTGHRNLRLINADVCGPATDPRIFGGNKTGVLEFPWMALISYNTAKPKPEFKCGGTLISERYILTAAHCVTDLPSGNSLRGVRLGEHDLNTEQDCEAVAVGEFVCADAYQDISAETTHIHADYSRQTLQNDIALIRLVENAVLRPNVKPICLPFGSSANLVQKKVIVTGWGTTETGYRSQDLLKVKLPIVPADECSQTYRQHKIEISYKQLCAGGANQMDSCAGDSGGPMQVPVVVSNQVKYLQYGIVSFGPKICAIEGFPGVYTSVPYYIDWILDTMTD